MHQKRACDGEAKTGAPKLGLGYMSYYPNDVMYARTFRAALRLDANCHVAVHT